MWIQREAKLSRQKVKRHLPQSSESRTFYALYLLNFNALNLSVLQGVSPTSTSALKSFKIFLSIRSSSLKRGNFAIRQRKFKNNTDVYLQDFLQYYAQFPFLNRKQFESPMTKMVSAMQSVFEFYFSPSVKLLPSSDEEGGCEADGRRDSCVSLMSF